MKLLIAMILICAANIVAVAWTAIQQPRPQVMCPMKVQKNMRGLWRV